MYLIGVYVSDKNIQCRILSETYELLDAWKVDNGTSADHNDIWTTSNTDITRGNEYTTISEITSGTTAYVTIMDIPYTDYHIDVDVFQVDGTQNEGALHILTSTYGDIDWITGVVGEWKHISIDKTGLPLNTRLRIITGGSCTTTQFKNFKIYPI